MSSLSSTSASSLALSIAQNDGSLRACFISALREVVPPEDVGRILNYIMECLNSSTPANFEECVKPALGEKLWTQLAESLLRCCEQYGLCFPVGYSSSSTSSTYTPQQESSSLSTMSVTSSSYRDEIGPDIMVIILGLILLTGVFGLFGLVVYNKKSEIRDGGQRAWRYVERQYDNVRARFSEFRNRRAHGEDIAESLLQEEGNIEAQHSPTPTVPPEENENG